MDILEEQQYAAMEFGSHPLLVHPDGQALDLATGYIPLLSTFSHEDKAAKGLRKGKTSDEVDNPLYFSALELVRDNRILMLSGPCGCGKTTFAKHLCFRLASNTAPRSNCILRNENGDLLEESWDTNGLSPCYFGIKDARMLDTIVNETLTNLLSGSGRISAAGLVIAVDAIEHAEEQASQLLAALVSTFLQDENSKHRLVILVDARALDTLKVPPNLARHTISPLLVSQRRHKISELTNTEPHLVEFGLGTAACNTSIFALAVQMKDTGCDAEKLLDAWLYAVSRDEEHLSKLERNALQKLSDELGFQSKFAMNFYGHQSDITSLTSTTRRRQLLAARYISRLPCQSAVELFRHAPAQRQDVLRSVFVRLGASDRFQDLASVLLQGSDMAAQRAALLVAECSDLTVQLREQVVRLALEVIKEAKLPLSVRVRAGRVLSSLGDPRELATLVLVPAGVSSIGSNTHANSQPVHEIGLEAFRIGVYPVTIREYSKFTVETSRQWLSSDKDDPNKQNVPATDLTWYDAQAYCSWLTRRWHASGEIKLNEEVRLPTEPEWERAARGDTTCLSSEEEHIYPWGTTWHQDLSHSEETGLNEPCPVGLFPNGRSPYGCHDMAGNVWEWCTTLWGEYMATPRFGYPWRQDDGREDQDAPATVRRVLRGGCFSSNQTKANCTYRGSLEPTGRWRGNGFRIVVSTVEKAQSRS